MTNPWTRPLPELLREVDAKGGGVGSTLGGTGVSVEWPEMQRDPDSSCSQYTSTIMPLGFCAFSVPGIPTNLAPTGICKIIEIEY